MTPGGGDKAKAVGCAYAADGFAVFGGKGLCKLV